MALVRTGYANFAAFPPTGAVDIIYVDLSNGNEYTWVTSAYVVYTPTLVGVSLGDKSAAWFTANPTLLLAKGQIVFLDDQSGQYKKGDGVTALSALSFLGGSSTTPTLQQVITESNVVSNGTIFQSTSGDTSMDVSDTFVQVNVGDGVDSSQLIQQPTYFNLAAPSVQKNGVEVATVSDIPSLTGYEQTANKQNSLATDGTGVKYPTVDAINEVVTVVYKLGSIITTTSTSPTTVSDFTIPLAANSEYILEGYLNVTCSGTGGNKFGVTFPTGTVFAAFFLGRSTSQTAFSETALSTSGTVTSAMQTFINGGVQVKFNCHIITAGTAGNFTFQLQAGVSGQTTGLYPTGSLIKKSKI